MKLHLPVRLFRAVLALFSFTVGIVTTLPQLYAASPDGDTQVPLVAKDSLLSEDDIISTTEEEIHLEVHPSLLSGRYDNGTISYIGDTVGAIELYDPSTFTLSDYYTVLFSKNGGGIRYGAAIYIGAEFGSIKLSDNGTVTFSENNVHSFSDYAPCGGAIHGVYSSTITLSDNETVSFLGNTASTTLGGSSVRGGAISGDRLSTITLSKNGEVIFSGNNAFSESSATAVGGAICVLDGTTTMSYNGAVSFSGNNAINSGSGEAWGGAIFVDGRITLINNDTVSFNGNTASGYPSAYGGAIFGEDSSTITLSDNGTVTFSENEAFSQRRWAYGGAIFGGDSSTITLSNNDAVNFSGNTVSATSGSTHRSGDAYGGAICGGSSSTITLSNNDTVSFIGNTVSGSSSFYFFAYGGAICGGSSSTITLSNNDTVSFSGNTASASASGKLDVSHFYAYGGAIYGDASSTITLHDNYTVSFSGNTASVSNSASGNYYDSYFYAYGGAIYGDASSTITLRDNDTVSFIGNTASVSDSASGNSYDSCFYAYGGAIYGDASSTITLHDNYTVSFSGNTASASASASGNPYDSYFYACGGAIYSEGNLSIRNNGSVEFAGNVEKVDSSYRLRSIYAGGEGNIVSLSAAEGKCITFRDSVYIGVGATVELNADYKGLKQKGDILFTGATTEADLLAVKGSAGTKWEILNSRTSEVYAMTNLYGGRLRVEDGAQYYGRGITLHEGSEATLRVKDATLSHAGYDITLNAGTTLELEGCNTITAVNLIMQEGSNLHFALGKTNRESAALTLDGSLLLNGAVNLSFDLSFDVTIGVYKLVSLSGSELLDWSQLTVAEGSGSGCNFTLNGDKTGLSLEIFWTQMELPQTEGALTLSAVTCGQMNLADTYSYDSISVTRGCYSLVGSGSVGVSGLLSVTGGADLTLDVDTTAMVVEVGDDSSLSLQKRLNLVSLMTLTEEGTESSKAISVGRNAELSLTDAALLGQVATADETSAVYYQTETGDKLLKFTGDLGNGGLNLTLGEDGKTVSAADSAGFTGNITVLSGTTLVNEATSTTDGVPFGDTYATAADKTITVQGGATLDINGRETYYHLVLEKDALLTNSGTDTHHDWKGVPVIDLSGDAEVNAAAQICMVGAGYATNTLNLNGNTLTKTGSANLVLRNTSINEGTLAVNGGLVRFMGNTSTAAGTSIQVNNGGTLWISEGTGNYAGSLVLNTGGHVYLGEGPSGTLGGDNETNSQTISLTGLGKLELAGGTMTFRGENLNMGTVDVTAASTLELWDQTGSNGVAATASTISTLNMSANLNLATTWKSSLDIARLTGSGELLVGSSRQKHKVSVQDLSGFTGTFAIRGANSTLSLNLSGDDEMNAARVTKDDSAVLILEGSGTYCFSNLENVAAAATGISDIQFGDTWSGKIALRNSTAIGMELDDFGGAGKTIVIEGVSGWVAYNRTVESHLQLVESGLTLLDTSMKTYTYTGGISGNGDFIIKSKTNSAYIGTYDLSGDLSAWDGAFRVQQSGDNTNTAPVNLKLTGGGTLFSGTDGCGVLMERTGDMNVTIGNAGTATTMRGDIRNVGVTNEGTTTYGNVNVILNNTVDAQGDIIASRINVGAGADINFSGTVQADRWMVGKDASLCLGTGAVVYLSEAPNGVMEGDLQTDDRGTLELTEATVELAGGRLSYRGKNMAMGEVNVTSDSVLEIWDQTGSNGVAGTACTIDSLNLDAALTQTTTWKCTLEIDTLTGSGPLAIQSRNEKHNVAINDISGYTGEITISNANTTLALNLGKDVVLDASRVTKDDASTLVLAGTGSYNIGTGRGIAAGVTFAEGWQGSVRLTGTLAGETLSGLSDEDSWVELYGVSGYLSQADAAAGAQTYGMNLKLTDAGETAAWNLNNGWNGDVRTFTGMVCGTGTLNRNHDQGTEQTLIFAGDVSGWSGALEHNATSATNNGQKVKTNVTFNGSSEINVAMRTNGKGELNVTLDDANLAAGSKVTVNNAVSATNFTVTEGTAARLNSSLQLSGMAELRAAASLELGNVVTLSAGTETATMDTVSVSDSEIRGTAATSAIRNMHLGDMNGDFSIANVGMHAVDISGSNATLTLANVNLDDTCSINLGSGGSISFADSMLGITLAELPVAGTDTLHIDCSALLQSSAYGNLELNFNFTTEEMCNRGYQTLSVEFGAAADYSNLELSLSKAEFKGFVGNIAQFKLVPEPTTTTLSLLALSALVARRRRR